MHSTLSEGFRIQNTEYSREKGGVEEEGNRVHTHIR